MVNSSKQNNRQLLRNSIFAKTGEIQNLQSLLNRVPLPIGIKHWLQARSFKRAVNRAYRQFVQQHEQWVDSYFDQYFIERHIPLLLDYYRQNNKLTISTELANLWADQFAINSSVRRHIGEARAIAGIFLALVEAEL